MSDMKKLIESMDRLAGTGDQIPGDQVKGTEKYPFLHRLVGEADSENPFTAIALAKLEKLAYSRKMDSSDVEALRQSITHNINRYGANVETIQRILDMFGSRIRKSGKYNNRVNDQEAIKQCLLHALKRQDVPVSEMVKRLQEEYDSFLTEGASRGWCHNCGDDGTIDDGECARCGSDDIEYGEVIDEYGSVGSGAPLPQAQPGQVPPAPGVVPANVAVPGKPPVTSASPAVPPVPGQAVPPAQAGKPMAPGTQPAAVTPEQVAMGFLAGMGNKNPSPAEVINMARMLGKGMAKVK